jgi:hypothetical protein
LDEKWLGNIEPVLTADSNITLVPSIAGIPAYSPIKDVLAFIAIKRVFTKFTNEDISILTPKETVVATATDKTVISI